MDIEQSDDLLRWLRAQDLVAAHEIARCEPLSGGVSNRTVLVHRQNGEDIVVKQALEKLRVAVDWFSPPERVHREALGLSWLSRLKPSGSVPQLLAEDFAEHTIAMSAVPQPHSNWKIDLLAGRIDLSHFSQCGRLLAQLFRLSRRHADEAATAFSERSFFESLRLEPYYLYTAQQVPIAAEFLHDLVDSTRSRRDGIVHGDYSPKNFLIHDGHLRLLDFEVIHWGDPSFDAGFALSHFLSKAHHLDAVRSRLGVAAETFVNSFCETAEDVPPDWGVRTVEHTLACLLARVSGRSPLEYLTASERSRQTAAVLHLLRARPGTPTQLITEFLKFIEP